jgi:hypothetical protein
MVGCGPVGPGVALQVSMASTLKEEAQTFLGSDRRHHRALTSLDTQTRRTAPHGWPANAPTTCRRREAGLNASPAPAIGGTSQATLMASGPGK